MTNSLHRTRVAADGPIGSGQFVLYWMTATRRTSQNFALDRAAHWCDELGQPLLIVEPLTCRPDWATLRFHQFLLDGMRDNQRACEKAGVRYYPYIEPSPGADRGFFRLVAQHASVVVSDDSTVPLMAKVGEALATHSPIRCELVDSMGLLPFHQPDRAFTTAASFRRHLQSVLPDEFGRLPSANPLKRIARHGTATVPREVSRRFPSAQLSKDSLATLPIDHSIGPDDRPGGREAGLSRLARFVESHVDRYGERGDLMDVTHSALSPYFHFGHVGPHDVLQELSRAMGWTPPAVWPRAHGARHGWWGLSAPVESFLDEVVTWRELSINGAAYIPNYRTFDSLPEWARETLLDHAQDARPTVYNLEIFESAMTHDPLWNAAQMELVTKGKIHSYLRMLWGKKILEWTTTPREALDIMIHLNDTYATDGRDPNSYSGIFWVLGRYDRPWVERPIFGKVRYMTSDSTAKKFRTDAYVEEYAPGAIA